MSSYGHMAVLHDEGHLSDSRIILLAITVILGIIHLTAIISLYFYYKILRNRPMFNGSSTLESNALLWFMVSAIGRYYHFLDNHYQPQAYHDGDKIFCGIMFADTDAFIPFQIIHISLGIYATNVVFRDQTISKRSFNVILAFGLICCVGFLHFFIEPVYFFALPQQISIWGEGITGLLLMFWARNEYHKIYRGNRAGSNEPTSSWSQNDESAYFHDTECAPLMRSDLEELSSANHPAAPVRRRSKDAAKVGSQ